MKAYGRRFIKFFLFIIILFFIMLFLIPLLTRGVSFEETYYMITSNQRMRLILILLFAYAFIYPLINYTKKERYITGLFEDNRSAIEEVMEATGYVKLREENAQLIYRRKSKFARIIMMGEDRVEIDSSVKPLIFSGPRRDLKRIDILMDEKLLGKSR
ncbi:MAG: hypothetical protein JXK95_07390 [Bacteroidales bacterium]|nr:hypothetical protein [Bacteroidales bacterium]